MKTLFDETERSLFSQKVFCSLIPGPFAAVWGPAAHGLSLADGAAFAAISGVNLTPYVGVEGSSTPYLLRLRDPNNKLAFGYLGASCTGESLTTQMLAASFDTISGAWIYIWCLLASVAGGQTGNCLQMTGDGGDSGGYQLVLHQSLGAFTTGKLYKLTGFIKSGTSGDESYSVCVALNDSIFYARVNGITSGSWVPFTIYFTAKGPNHYLYFMKNTLTAGTMLWDEFFINEVAEGPITGAHVVSTKNGSTRNWTCIDASFNKNAPYYGVELFAA